MSQELIYTSTTKGLKLGSRGFCTVASTSGMAKNLADRLEALSGYKHLFSTGDPQAKLNPVNTSYLRFKLGGRVYYVLSRIADAGLDYTQRTNKLAHHVVLSREELAIAGPAWVASQGGFFQTIWEGEARILPSDRPIPQGDLQIGVCHAWARIVGDAGWAGVLAESILKRSSTEAYLVCKPGTDVLALFLEAQALLPPDKRWEATFSTYFTKVPPGVECRWRCVIDGTPEAVRARRSPEKLVIDLTGPRAVAEGGRLVVAARSGVLPELDEIETIQPVGGEVQQKTPALPPSVPPAEINLKVGPPVLPRQKEAVFRSAGHKVEEQSIWKVVAIISLLVIALIGGAFIRSIYSSRVPEVPSAKEHAESAGDNHSSLGDALAEEEAREAKEEAGLAREEEAGPARPEKEAEKEARPEKEAEKEARPTREDEEEARLAREAEEKERQFAFSEVHRKISLFYPPLGNQGGPISLGNFPQKYLLELEMATVVPELAPQNPLQLSKIYENEWHLKDKDGKVLANIVAAKLEDDPNAELSFSWSGNKGTRKVLNAVRHAGIRLEIPNAPPAYVCFYPDDAEVEHRKPLTFNKRYGIDNPFNGSIPPGQVAVLHYRASTNGEKGQPSFTKKREWAYDTQHQAEPIVLPLEDLNIELKYILQKDRKIGISFSVVPRVQQERNLTTIIKEEGSARQRLLKAAILDYVKVLHEFPGKRKELEEYLHRKSTSKDNRNSITPLLGQWKQYLKGKSVAVLNEACTDISNMLQDLQGEINDSEDKEPLRNRLERALENVSDPIEEALNEHRGSYPLLLNRINALETLRLHLQISWRLRIPKELDADIFPLFPIYIAGTPTSAETPTSTVP